jgi:hypothetical protein
MDGRQDVKITDEMVSKYVLARYGDDFLSTRQENSLREQARIDLCAAMPIFRTALATQPDRYAAGFEKAREMFAATIRAMEVPGDE